MVEIEAVYRGDLRTEARHGPSQQALVTDAPVDNHGRGESFSPTDLVATALGSCTLTIMGIVAQRHDWPLEGARVRVVKEMTAQPTRRIGKLSLEFHLSAALEPAARRALEKAAHSCPVHRSLHPDVELPMVFHYDA